MRFLPLMGFLLGGCVSGCGGHASRIEKVPEEFLRPKIAAPKVTDRHPYGDVTKVRPGQWATYKEGERTLTVAAVGSAGDSVWVEVIDESEPRAVSARLVAPDGVVRKAYYGEISKNGVKSSIEAQALEQDASTGSGAKESGRETDDETVTVAGRDLKCKRVSVRFEDLEGRLLREITLWHKEVPPVYAGCEEGGLVKRTTSTSTVVLVAFGDDAKPLLDLPQ
jgi:hypothetical protein